MPARPLSSSGVLGAFLVALAAVDWGLSSVLVRYLLVTYAIDPLALTSVRTGIASATMFGFMHVRRRTSPRAYLRDVMTIGAIGTLTLGVSHGTFTLAIFTVGASIASLLNYTAPAFVVIAAWLLLRERIGYAKLIALCACAVGVILITRPWEDQASNLPFLGVVFGIVSGMAYAGFTLAAKVLAPRYGADRLIAVGLAFASLELGLASAGSFPHLFGLLDRLWYWFLFLGVVQTLGGWLLYTAGLRRIQASATSLIATLEPVTATAVSAALLGESLDPLQLAGAAAILIGAVIAARSV